MTDTFTGIVRTQSGSRYEFKPGMVRRVNDDAHKRADGEWVQLRAMFPKTPTVGYRLSLVLETLAAHGPDDDGNEGGIITTRLTSAVTSCEPSQ